MLAGEVLDAAVMRRAALDAFLAEQVAEAKEQGVLFSVHLKATMMKVSDPIIFGHAVRAVVGDVYDGLDASPNDGLGSLLSRAPRGRAGGRRRPRRGPVDRDGRLRQGHHEPARALGRHRRCLDARGHPLVGADVERGRRAAGHEVRHPRLLVRAAVRGDDRPLPRARRVRSVDDGDDAERRPHGAEGRGVRLARQDVRDRVRGNGARGRRRRRDAHRARGRRRRHLAHVPDEGRGDRRLGAARRRPCARDRGARGLLARRDARARRGAAEEGPARARRARRRRPADRDPARRRGDALHAAARPRGRGHDLRHRQRPARLPHRPLPDPRARDEREDALDRAAHERRRPVRDGRRRVGARSTSSSCSRRTTCAGTRSGSSSRSRCRWRCSPRRPTTRAPGCSARRWTGRPAACSRTAARRRAAAASSTTAAATSTSRCTGRRSSPPRTRTASSRRASRRWPSGSPPTSRRSSPSSPPCRASRWTSAATTAPTPRASMRSCGRARRSPRRWRCSRAP